MVKQQEKPAVRFAGTKREQETASQLLNLMLARGMFMSANAPIKLPIATLADYLESQGEKDGAARIDAAAAANPEVFVVEDINGERYLVTTRDGRAPVMVVPSTQHSFSARFLSPPLPKPAPTGRAAAETAPGDAGH
jgi:hypothetical protein